MNITIYNILMYPIILLYVLAKRIKNQIKKTGDYIFNIAERRK
jgi:hypothetical protein